MIGQTVSHYRILEQLGEGGMGVVYRAEDQRLDRIVALKFLAPEFVRDSDSKSRFVHEAKAASALDHPNICTIHGIEETADGRLFIAMACYEGETLKELTERGPLEVTESVEIALQMAQGLAKAHSLGIVHRDIKPANIFLTRDGLVKLLDFGIAKLAGQTAVTRTGGIVGTMHYMSPEQLQGEGVDRRTDLWSFGVVLYRMLAGRLPFTGDNQQAVINATLNKDPAPIGEQRDDVPPELELVVVKCLSKPVAERYQDAEAVLADLQKLADQKSTRGLRQRTAGQHTLADAQGIKPYPGLASFSEANAEYFHGRESQVEAVWQKLRHGRLLAVAGPSGVGKTSFLRAGLVPAKPSSWGVLLTTPGGSPFLSLREALVRELAGDTEAMLALLRENELDTDVATVRRWRQRHDEGLLVFDQFEELFTLSPPEEQARFADLISRLILEADVRVLVSMRDDFLYHCQEHAGLAPISEALTLLSPLTGPALHRALVQPALDCGYDFEDSSLVDEMMAEVEGERGALPLLAFAMSRLWEHRDREQGLLIRQAYEEIGAVSGALVQHAEAVMEQIGTERHPLVRELFRNLITAQGTRAVCDREQLLSVFSPGDLPAAEGVLGQLVDARLLTSYEVKGEDGAAHRRIEIVHESLLSAWPRLVRWQTQDADSAQLRDQLRQAAQLWEQKGRSDDLLWTGTAFREFELWRERYPGGLSRSEESFAAAMARREARRKRRRRLTYASSIVGLLVIIAIVAGLWQQAQVETRRSEAHRLHMLAESTDMTEDNTLVFALAAASLEREDNPETRRIAQKALSAAPLRTVLTVPDTLLNPFSAVLSPDGKWLATVNEDGVLLWPRKGDQPRTFLAEEVTEIHETRALDIDPSGRFIVASRIPALRKERSPKTIRRLTLWSVADGQRLRTWQTDQPCWTMPTVRGDPPHLLVAMLNASSPHWKGLRYVLDSDTPEELGPAPGTFFLIDQSGSRLLYLDGDGVYIASLDSLQTASPLLVGRHEHALVSVVFDENEECVASQDESGEIRIWSPGEDGSYELRQSFQIQGVVSFITDLDLSRSRLAYCADSQGRIDLIDLDLPQAQPVRLLPFHYFMASTYFTPGGGWLIVPWFDERFGGGREVYFYALEGQRPAKFRILPDDEDVWPEYFLPDGSTVVARANHNEILLCKVITSQPDYRSLWRNPGDRFETSWVGSTGRYVFVNDGHNDQTCLIPVDGSEPIILSKPQGPIYGIGMDSQERRAAVGGSFIHPINLPDDPIIRIHDLRTGDVQVLEAEGECGFFGIRFLPDERLLAYGHEGLLLWDLTSGEYEVLSEKKHTYIDVDMDARQRFLLALTTDGVTLWDLEERTERILPLPATETGALAISLDASFVVAGQGNGDVYVLPLDTEEPYLLLGHDDGITAIWISPTGDEIRTASADGIVCIWDLPTGPRLHSMPHAELLEIFRTQTNLRVVTDADAPDGYRIVYDDFPGWETAPTW